MIILVSGPPRSGKTFYITFFALILADNGVKVNTNLSLFDRYGKKQFINNNWTGKTHQNAKLITPYDLVRMMENKRVYPEQWICCHEFFAWMSSHKAMSDVNNFGEIFCAQSAKLGYNWIIDSQIVKKIDDMFRILADIRLESEKIEEEKCFRYYELDTHFPDKDIRTGNSFDIPFFLASYFWNRYDTFTPLEPIGIANLKAKMEQLEPEIFNETINRQTKILFDKRRKYGLDYSGKITTIAVKDALIQEREPHVNAEFVANRLKLSLRNMGN